MRVTVVQIYEPDATNCWGENLEGLERIGLRPLTYTQLVRFYCKLILMSLILSSPGSNLV